LKTGESNSGFVVSGLKIRERADANIYVTKLSSPFRDMAALLMVECLRLHAFSFSRPPVYSPAHAPNIFFNEINIKTRCASLPEAHSPTLSEFDEQESHSSEQKAQPEGLHAVFASIRCQDIRSTRLRRSVADPIL
jgi:hypothetical protein